MDDREFYKHFKKYAGPKEVIGLDGDEEIRRGRIKDTPTSTGDNYLRKAAEDAARGRRK